MDNVREPSFAFQDVRYGGAPYAIDLFARQLSMRIIVSQDSRGDPDMRKWNSS